MATARSIRSNAAPASNRPHTKHQSSSRPELRVVSNPRGNEQGNVVGRVIEWTRTRSAPLVHVAIAVIFLVGTLFGALMLRTQMVQNSYEIMSAKLADPTYGDKMEKEVHVKVNKDGAYYIPNDDLMAVDDALFPQNQL